MIKIKYLQCLTFASCLFYGMLAEAQSLAVNKKDWYNSDLEHDSTFGISSDRAYFELLRGKVSNEIIVAVLDGGVDIRHVDLNGKIWCNKKEIPGNMKDDDNNGYIDDINGWNFMASSEGSFQYDNIDLVRRYREELKKDSKSLQSKVLKIELDDKILPLKKDSTHFESKLRSIESIISHIGKNNPSEGEFRNYRYHNFSERKELVAIVNALRINPDFEIYKNEILLKYNKYKYQLRYLTNLDYDPRGKNDGSKVFQNGNADVIGLNPIHGTHISGIICADRKNVIGIKGVADNIRIMSIRCVPIGDYLDLDIAKAIYYAVNNGAKVINMSMTKGTKTNKKDIDDAVKYAMSKDVIIVHSCGNEGMKLNSYSIYPSREYEDGSLAENWIEVGASGPIDDSSLLGSFSNYGENYVDVFAPGVRIYSTAPENSYLYSSGTSMAAPVVTGLAALIRSYYPKFTAKQVKEILLKSVKKVNHTVKNRDGVFIPFTTTCLSGGIINAVNALLLAKKL